MLKYRLINTVFGLQLVIVILFDVENIPEESIPEIMAVAKMLGVKIYAYAFWPKHKSNRILKRIAKRYGIEIIPVTVKEAGDQATDNEICEWIEEMKFPHEANVISVAASDNGYLRLRDKIRLSSRLFINFREGRIGKDFRGKYDYCYDLKGMEHEPSEDIWMTRERLERLLVLRQLENQSF